ncbi:Os10g0568200, partial [Oryza sativa Japonica Group]
GALDGIPLALAENSGLPPFDTSTAVNPQQVKFFFFLPPELPLQDSNPHHGIDCNCIRTNGIREQNKQQQIVLTTQVVKMILKIDDIITQSDC